MRHATSVTLFRVHGSYDDEDERRAGTALLHQAYVIEASGPALDPRASAAALLGDLAPAGSPIATCFLPSYAMRVSDSTRTLDYVICFHCKQAIVYEGETELGTDPIMGTGADVEALFVASQITVVHPAAARVPKRF